MEPGNGNKDGWTIKIKSGTYDRFTIPADFKNITVEGEKNSVIQVMNASVADNLSDAGGINAFGSNITLKGLKTVRLREQIHNLRMVFYLTVRDLM